MLAFRHLMDKVLKLNRTVGLHRAVALDVVSVILGGGVVGARLDEGCHIVGYRIKAQIPLYRLPRDVRDKPVTSSLAQIPGKFRGSRRNGIWALQARFSSCRQSSSLRVCFNMSVFVLFQEQLVS